MSKVVPYTQQAELTQAKTELASLTQACEDTEARIAELQQALEEAETELAETEAKRDQCEERVRRLLPLGTIINIATDGVLCIVEVELH